MIPPTLNSPISEINDYLRPLAPPQILEWAITHLPHLYQTTAFGLTGLVAIDMLSKITSSGQPPLIFIDTLYHFPETYALVAEVEKRYGVKVNVFKPEGCESVADFEKKWGERFWARDEDTYDFAVKVRYIRLGRTGDSDVCRSSLLSAPIRRSMSVRSSLVDVHRRVLLVRRSNRSR